MIGAIASAQKIALLPGAGGKVTGAVIGRKPATGTVDATMLHQEIAGFGASEAFYQSYLTRHAHSKEIYDALFGPVNGLHTDFLRLQNSFRYVTSTEFATDSVEIVQHANALRTSPMTIVMSSWSPPAVLKSNGSEKNGGTLIKKSGHYDYADFAQYWQDSVVVYRALGIDPTYVSIQNEPDETTAYESCRFNPTEAPFRGESYAGYAEAVDAVYKAFQKLPSPPRLLGPETIGIGFGTEQAFAKAQNAAQIYAVTHHLYTGGDKDASDTYIPVLQAIKDENPQRLRFQTEYYTATGYETALMIHNSLVVEEVSLYLYWPYAWPSEGGTLLNVENPNEPAKWKTPQGWSYTDGYYALKHYSYFIHAGYRRVEARSSTDNIKLSAYVSSRREQLVIIAINSSNQDAQSITLRLGEFEHGRSQVYRTTFGDGDEHFASMGSLPPGQELRLPPHSIVTVAIAR